MQAVNILIVENSYIISKGLQSIINEIENYNYTVISEQDCLKSVLSKNKYDIVICNNSFYKSEKEIINSYKSEVVIIDSENQNQTNFFIDIFEKDKQTINSVIQSAGKNKIQEKNKPEEISEREIEIVRCIAKGMTNKEIADELFISMHTVITHRKNITRKLGIKTVSGLTVYAILNNIIDINEIK